MSRLSKQRLLDFLEEELGFHQDEADGEYAYQKFFYSIIIYDLIQLIERGIFDEPTDGRNNNTGVSSREIHIKVP